MPAPVQPEPLVLASASPRRALLLADAGYRFVAVPSELLEPEPQHAGESPASYAEAIAYFKAAGVGRQHPNATILAADTMAVVGGEVLNKAGNRAEAERMLRLMLGTRHRVVTGVVLFDPATGRRMLRHEVTTVQFRNVPDAVLNRYLDSGDWAGKAGAYGIQDCGDEFVESVEGSFSNVVGLPMELLARMLAEWCRSRPA